jgi:hypothetical protein
LQNFEVRDDAALASEDALADYLVKFWAPTDWLERMSKIARDGPPDMTAVRSAEGKTKEVDWTRPAPPPPTVVVDL